MQNSGSKTVVRATIALLAALLISCATYAQSHQKFRFAFVSDTHVGSTTGAEDLRRTVHDINDQPDLAFVIISGDITEMGSNDQLVQAKIILDSLRIPYHVIPGNHDTKWSESGCTEFSLLWQDDKFNFEFGGFRFIGCSSGPNMRMGDGHVPPEDIRWLDSVLVHAPDRNEPLIFVNHYPLDPGLDNWYEVTDRLRKYNTVAVLCGHGHTDKALTFEGTPATMGRSNLRAKQPVGGYTIVEATDDSLLFSERNPGTGTGNVWRKISITHPVYQSDTTAYPRPDYSINRKYPDVREVWSADCGYSIGSTPALWNNLAIVGNSGGSVVAYSLFDGTEKWSFQTRGSIYSSPAVSDDFVVFGSADGSIYCLKADSGKLKWNSTTSNAVVASPLIHNGIVFEGSSDHNFRALDLASGRVKWMNYSIQGFVETKPLLYEDKVIFGAWDTYLYALDERNGKLIWKWSNGIPNRLFSPAACIPVGSEGKVFIVAPDRQMTAIDAGTGTTVWRTGAHQVREMLGISEDAERIYVRLMNDSVLAFSASRATPTLLWQTDCQYGYDIDPSAPVEKDGALLFGTKNGLVYSLDAKTGSIRWVHKLGNTIVNTVRPLSDRRVLVTTMDGKISLIESAR